MKALLMASIMFVGAWFSYDEMRSGNVDLKLQSIQMSGVPAYHLIHFGAGTGWFDEWIDKLVSAMPEGHKLMYCCSSLRKCEFAIDRLPGVNWIAYDLEGWAHSEGDQDDIVASVRAAVELAHAHGKKLAFIPCSKLLYDENHHLIPIVAEMVDLWVVQGQWFQLTESDYISEVTKYHRLIRLGNQAIPVLIQLRLNRYDWKGNDGWDPYYPLATHTGIGLYNNYWMPVAHLFDGVLIADYADDNNPAADWRRPGTYHWFMVQQWQKESIGPVTR